MIRPVLVVLGSVWLWGCDTSQAQEAADKSKEMADKAVADGNKAVEGTKDAIDDGRRIAEEAKDKGQQLADDAKHVADEAGKLWADVPDTGQLSQTADGWLAAASKGSDSTIAELIVSGEQMAPVAVDISRALAGAIETDKKIEPIYQKVEPGHEAKVDEAIGDMPRTEVIDGLTVGFRRLDETSTQTMVKERGYLVMWREQEHLVGFVYRSKRTIDLETLVAETPRILGLARRAID